MLLQYPVRCCLSLIPNPGYTAENVSGWQDFWDVAQKPDMKQVTDYMI